jgi:hypothetical protein
MSATWEYQFDDGSGSCAFFVSYPASVGQAPPKTGRIIGTWQASVSSTGAISIDSIEANLTDVMLPLVVPDQTTSWVQLASPVLTLFRSSTPHPHLSTLPRLNTGQIDLANRFTQLSWGVKLASPTLTECDLDDIVIAYHETGYLHEDHSFGLLGGSGVITAPSALGSITLFTSNVMRKIRAPAP